MRRNAAFLACTASLILILSARPATGASQQTATTDSSSVSGTVADASGKPIAHARLALNNAAGQQLEATESDAAGKFLLSGVKPGEYDVTVSAEGFAGKTMHVIVTDAQGLLDISLAAQSPAGAAPSAPSLSDLGFSNEQTQGDPKLQALLKRRTEMLRTHQRLGLITTAPMVAALFTGGSAKAKGRNGSTIREPGDTGLDLHFALGAATGALYGLTASYAIRAPRVPGTHKHGAIQFHEALAWVHGPGMIATGALGLMAWKQENSGEKVHGLASAHGPVAIATTIAYGTSMIAVSWPIHVKFWEKK
jgi:hypothetical protein